MSENQFPALKIIPTGHTGVPQGIEYGPYRIMHICKKNTPYALKRKFQIKATLAIYGKNMEKYKKNHFLYEMT